MWCYVGPLNFCIITSFQEICRCLVVQVLSRLCHSSGTRCLFTARPWVQAHVSFMVDELTLHPIFLRFSSVFPCYWPFHHSSILICYCAKHVTSWHIIISSTFKLEIFISDQVPVGQRVRTLSPAQWLLYKPSPVTSGDLLHIIITANNDGSCHSINRSIRLCKKDGVFIVSDLTRKQVNNAYIWGCLLSTILETAQI